MWRKRMLLMLVVVCALIAACLAFGSAGAGGSLEQAKKLFDEKKYAEAEKVYLEIAGNGTPEALTAQGQLALLYIASGELPKADTAYQQLLNRFAGQEGIPQAVWEVARGYGGAGEKAKAIEINKYNVEHFPNDKYAMWSQVEIAYSHIKDSEESKADAAIDKLINTFSGQESLPKEIHNIAKAYSKAKRNDKALELYKYNVDYYPQDKYAMWSQVESVYCHVQDGNETAADEAVDKLIEVFSEQPTFPKELYQIGMKCQGLRFKKKAIELHAYNVEHYPDYDDVHAMWSQVEIAKSHVRDGNEVAAQQAYDKLLTTFSVQETFPKEVCIVGDVYCQQGNCDRATQIYQSVMDKWPNSKQLVWARAGMAKVDIALGDEDNAKDKIDSIIVDFKDSPDLAEAVFDIGGVYWNEALTMQSTGYIGGISKTSKGLIPDQSSEVWDSMAEGEKVERLSRYENRLRNAIGLWSRIIQEMPEEKKYTAMAYYFCGRCHEVLNEYEDAIEKYEVVVERWPDFRYSWKAQYLITRCIETLMKDGGIPTEEGALRIRDACNNLLDHYPDSKTGIAAEIMLKKWAHTINAVEKGEVK